MVYCVQDTEALCIVAGEKVWQLRVDVHILDHGGNVIDAAALAAIAALQHFRRPGKSNAYCMCEQASSEARILRLLIL